VLRTSILAFLAAVTAAGFTLSQIDEQFGGRLVIGTGTSA
jgi:hypothetical protein